uniref:Uncharacterized protein n=1 Tax=viral metagenome TaxID=1070528 RepID=A0A6C0AD72_9ZZZZ
MSKKYNFKEVKLENLPEYIRENSILIEILKENDEVILIDAYYLSKEIDMFNTKIYSNNDLLRMIKITSYFNLKKIPMCILNYIFHNDCQEKSFLKFLKNNDEYEIVNYLLKLVEMRKWKCPYDIAIELNDFELFCRLHKSGCYNSLENEIRSEKIQLAYRSEILNYIKQNKDIKLSAYAMRILKNI